MTTFLIIGAVGIALVLVTLILGDVLDGALGLDALDSDLFSISSIAAFVGAFGFGGALSLALVPNTLLAVVVGAGIGSTAAWGAVWLTRALRSGEDTATFRSEANISGVARGRSTSSIPRPFFAFRTPPALAATTSSSATPVWSTPTRSAS